MTNDIRRGIDAAFATETEGPPPDLDEIVAAGRKGRRRRHLAGGGAVFATVVALAVGAVALGPWGAASGDPTTNPAGGDENISADPDDAEPDLSRLPELDPDLDYEWDYPDSNADNDLGEAYTAAMIDHLEQTYPAAVPAVLDSGPEQEAAAQSPDPFSDLVKFVREERVLYAMTDANDPSVDREKVYEGFSYSLHYSMYLGEPGGAYSPQAAIGFGGDYTANEAIGIEVYPAGAFSQDTGDLFDLAGCENLLYEASGCEPETVDDFVHVSGTLDGIGQQTGTNGPLRFVVQYRDDGSAVVVSTRVEQIAGVPSVLAEPTLTFDQLEDFAEAVPDDPVR